MDRLSLPRFVARYRLIAIIPDEVSVNLLAPVEVMVQERVRAFSFGMKQIDALRETREIFGLRADFGVHGLQTLEDARLAIDAGAAFALPHRPDDQMIAELLEAGISTMPPALTPNEVHLAWASGATAVQVTPAEVMGGNYPATLQSLAPDVSVVPRGGLGGYSVRRWLSAGRAAAVCLDDALVGSATTGGSMADLRERCQTFADIVD